jgi:hypothetical protein
MLSPQANWLRGDGSDGSMERNVQIKDEERISPAFSQSSRRYDTYPVQQVIACPPERIVFVIPISGSQE